MKPILLKLAEKILPKEYKIIKSIDDHPGIKTKVTAWYTDTGEVIFTKHNKITLAGAGFLARSLFDLPGNSVEITPSYNNALNLDGTVNTTTITSPNKAYLFCVGYDGCGRENSQVYAEKYASWISPTDGIVPFQYRPLDTDLNSYEKTIYFGKKTTNSNIAYYFKKFDSDPALVQQLTDGTPIDSTIYDMTTDQEAQTLVTMQMSITKSDCRDYFIDSLGLNEARINSLSLCTAWAKEDETTHEITYQDIRPCTRLNFPNEALIDTEKSISISYVIYF